MDITGPILAALALLAPGKLFHPVRASGSASNAPAVAALLAEHAKQAKQVPGGGGSGDSPSSAAAAATAALSPKPLSSRECEDARLAALCLLRNPRPPSPSYSCPIGCPWHNQRTCSHRNCMAREPEQGGTYHHMAFSDCLALCKQTGMCPWTTGTLELLALAKRGAGFAPLPLLGTFTSVVGE